MSLNKIITKMKYNINYPAILINLINIKTNKKNSIKYNKIFNMFILIVGYIKQNFNTKKLNKNINFIDSLKLKFFNLSVFKQKLIFYSIAKLIELTIYGIVVSIVVSTKFIYKILAIRPFILSTI